MGALQHITIPNSTLRRFLNDNNEIFYLDIDTKEIKKIEVNTDTETPRIMYNTTKQEFFSKSADDYIKEQVETKLGEAFEAINNLVNGVGKSDFRKKIEKFEYICKKYKDIAIKAVAIQTARNPQFTNQFGIERTRDLKIFQTAVKVYKKHLNHLYFNIAIIDKKQTNSTFVLSPSHCTFYGDNLQNNCTIFIPLSPYYALTLMTESNFEKCIINDEHNCVNLIDDVSIDCINHSAFEYASVQKVKHLIGYKEQLEYIKNKELKN